MRIFVTGSKGKLGSRVLELAQQSFEAEGEDVDTLDITDFSALKQRFKSFKPNVVIHAAAWTDVDGCAREPDKALRINGYGAQNVALAAHSVHAAMLHVSSNEVFDGYSEGLYREYDATNPINPYAYSKWVAERAVMTVHPRHYIARTSWLFAHGGRNFLHAIINAAEAGKDLRVVTDEIANPTYNDDLAEAIIKLVQTERYGIYHMVNEGAVSRYAFARYVLDRLGMTDVPIAPISRYEWPRPSTPPTYAGLLNIAGEMAGVTLRPWRDAVDAFLIKEGLLDSVD